LGPPILFSGNILARIFQFAKISWNDGRESDSGLCGSALKQLLFKKFKRCGRDMRARLLLATNRINCPVLQHNTVNPGWIQIEPETSVGLVQDIWGSGRF
jgi:hypothetical protein